MSSPLLPENQRRMVGAHQDRKATRSSEMGISLLEELAAADSFVSGLPHMEDDLDNSAALDVLFAAGVRLEAMIDDCMSGDIILTNRSWIISAV